MKELKLKIAGMGISFRWEGARIIDRSHPLYRSFISDGKVDVNFKVHCDNLPEFHPDKLLFDGKEGGNWKLYQSNSRFVIEAFDSLTHKKNKLCFLESDFRSGDVYIDPKSERVRRPRIKKGPFFSLPSLMQPLVEILLVNLLAKHQGIMIHGLGISDNGRGIAFLGKSGTGKSTLAEFYRTEKGASILSDEHIVIRKEKNQYYLYGTPWPGMAMTASSKGVPLKSIFFIEHWPTNKVLGNGTIVDLLPLLFLPFWDKLRIAVILQFCQDLIDKIECRKLGFVKDRSIIDFVRGR